ncbi:hypothetical protein L2K70_12390 [Nocardioides KLBMP 9356]|uniref:Chemotaxis protein CheX n=1 Tax=Nocardioides potassii TaxID=2911371 RepID=A0ABS9HDC7_9ACTN|nr:hypothetical protein [Nocardioides potassii]MCF6378404.1 hypothetical protein [Nocardioides potassii]
MSEWTLARTPNAMEVRELLSGLLGRDVEVVLSDAFTGDSSVGSTFAVYVDDQQATRVVAVMDLALSAWAGAAVGLMPAGGASDAIAERDLSPMLKENLAEVLNVMSALVNAEGAPHVRLDAVHHVDSWPHPQVLADVATPGRRLDLQVTVPQYGAGRLSVVGVR